MTNNRNTAQGYEGRPQERGVAQGVPLTDRRKHSRTTGI